MLILVLIRTTSDGSYSEKSREVEARTILVLLPDQVSISGLNPVRWDVCVRLYNEGLAKGCSSEVNCQSNRHQLEIGMLCFYLMVSQTDSQTHPILELVSTVG